MFTNYVPIVANNQPNYQSNGYFDMNYQAPWVYLNNGRNVSYYQREPYVMEKKSYYIPQYEYQPTSLIGNYFFNFN